MPIPEVVIRCESVCELDGKELTKRILPGILVTEPQFGEGRVLELVEFEKKRCGVL